MNDKKSPSPGKSIYNDDSVSSFLEENINQPYTKEAWDPERSDPLSTLKHMIRKYHSKTVDGKILVTAQVLRVEDDQKSLYQIRNPDDTTSNIQLLRYRVLSDRRHQWIPEPLNKSYVTAEQIINLHPLAKYELPEGESSPLVNGDIVEILFKDDKTPYSSYYETASVTRKLGNFVDTLRPIQRRCSNVTLPPLPPADLNANNLSVDQCLIVGNVDVGKDDLIEVQKKAKLNNKKLIFPHWVLGEPEYVTSPFGVVREKTLNDGRIQRYLHNGTDYAVSSVASQVSVIAAFDGEIIRSQFNPGGYGNYIVIQHDKYYLNPDDPKPTRFWTLYAHLGTNDDQGRSRVAPLPGKGVESRISRGRLIGIAGNSGRSISANGGDGSHLHFEYIVSDSRNFPGFGPQLTKDTRRDPVTEFFRRGFFIEITKSPLLR